MATAAVAVTAANVVLTALGRLSAVYKDVVTADVAQQWRPLRVQQLEGHLLWLKVSVLGHPRVAELQLPLQTLTDTLTLCNVAIVAITARAQRNQLGTGRLSLWQRKIRAVRDVFSGNSDAEQLDTACDAVEREVTRILDVALRWQVLLAPLKLIAGNMVPVSEVPAYEHDKPRFDEMR